MRTLICLPISSPATGATWRVSGNGGTHPPQRQSRCESLRLAFSFAVCSLPSLAAFPEPAPFCMPQRGTTEVYSSINSSAGNLPGSLHFHYNLLSPDSRGCLEIGSTVRGSTLYNSSLTCLDPFGVLCTNALGLGYLLQTASMKQGKNVPCFCLSQCQSYFCACGTKAEIPSTEHMKNQKSRSTPQPMLLVSLKGDTPLENRRHVPSLVLVSRM